MVEADDVEEEGDREERVVGRGGQLRRVRRSPAVGQSTLCRERVKHSRKSSSRSERARKEGRSASRAVGITYCEIARIGTP